MPKTQLIVALDQSVLNSYSLFRKLVNHVEYFKIRPRMLLQPYGLNLLHEIRSQGKHLLLDFKLFDTQDSVQEDINLIANDLGISMMTIHTDCLEQDFPSWLELWGVNSLTDGTGPCNSHPRLPSYLTGYVTGLELAKVYKNMKWFQDKNLKLMCPGIRLENESSDNHLHNTSFAYTPKHAAEIGVDYIIMGRSIYLSLDPVATVSKILADLETGA